MQFHIRRCRDLNLINKLKKLCFDKDSITDDDLNCTYWWVAWHKGVPAGFCGIQRWSTEKAYLNLAGVLKEFRGHGLQKKLIETRVKWAREMGCQSVHTYVLSWNCQSMRSLISRKFRPYEPENAWVEGDDVVFWKRVI